MRRRIIAACALMGACAGLYNLIPTTGADPQTDQSGTVTIRMADPTPTGDIEESPTSILPPGNTERTAEPKVSAPTATVSSKPSVVPTQKPSRPTPSATAEDTSTPESSPSPSESQEGTVSAEEALAP